MNEIVTKLISVVSIILIILFINFLLDSIIQKAIKIRNKKNVTTLLLFIKRIKKIVLFILGILICLSRFNMFNSFSVTLLSGLGVSSIILGLAAQESLKNFFGTIAIVVGSPFEVGDFIECVEKGVSGTVEDITMRHTIIRTINNRRIIIPNSEMNSFTIENFNYKDNETVKLIDYAISYEADIDKAIDLIKSEMKKLYRPNEKGRNKDVEYPKVRVGSWDDSGISLRAWVWGKDNSDVFENVYILNYRIKKTFEKNGIEIPYPHMMIVKK